MTTLLSIWQGSRRKQPQQTFVKGRDRWRQPILTDEQFVRNSQPAVMDGRDLSALQGCLSRCLQRWLAEAIELSLR